MISNYIFLAIVAVVVGLYIFDRFTGNNILVKVVSLQPVLDAMTLLAKALSGVTNSPQFSEAQIVFDAVARATRKAEDLYLLDAISKDERHDYAVAMVTTILTEANIEITDKISALIESAIILCCAIIPHNRPKEVSE